MAAYLLDDPTTGVFLRVLSGPTYQVACHGIMNNRNFDNADVAMEFAEAVMQAILATPDPSNLSYRVNAFAYVVRQLGLATVAWGSTVTPETVGLDEWPSTGDTSTPAGGASTPTVAADAGPGIGMVAALGLLAWLGLRRR
jgi:hypothetical protein